MAIYGLDKSGKFLGCPYTRCAQVSLGDLQYLHLLLSNSTNCWFQFCNYLALKRLPGLPYHGDFVQILCGVKCLLNRFLCLVYFFLKVNLLTPSILFNQGFCSLYYFVCRMDVCHQRSVIDTNQNLSIFIYFLITLAKFSA